MRSAVLFAAGLFTGLAVHVAIAQNASGGVVMMNHVGVNVPNVAEAVTYYTQKMGYREAFRVNDDKGQLIRNADGTPKYYYDVSYRSANTASEDFAKQLLILLGTLMTAITSFYLGAGTVTSAVKTGSEASTNAAPNPATLTSVAPMPHSISTNGTTIHLEITGTNLDRIDRVKLVMAGATIEGTGIVKTATRLTCDLDVTGASAGIWSIEVSEGANPAQVAGTVTITA